MSNIDGFKSEGDLALAELQLDLKAIQLKVYELQGISDRLDFFESFTSTRLMLTSSEKLQFGIIFKCTCKGKSIEEYAAKVEKGDDGLFTIPRCYLPISIDIDAVKNQYQPLNDINLKRCLDYLKDACFAFENRKYQTQQLQESLGDTVEIFSSISYEYVKLDFKLKEKETKTIYTVHIGMHYQSEDIRPKNIEIEKTNLPNESLLYIVKKFNVFKLNDLKIAYSLATMKKEDEPFYFVINEKPRNSSETSARNAQRRESSGSEMSSSSSDE